MDHLPPASVQMVSTPEEKETAFTTDTVGREGVPPAQKIDNVEDACVDKDTADVKRAMEEHQRLYTENQGRLLSAIDTTSVIVTDLQEFSNNQWSIHYPEITTTPILSHTANDQHSTEKEVPTCHPGLQRSFTHQPNLAAAQTEQPATARKAPHRSETTRDMSVLKLDLKVGPADKSPSSLVHTLEKSTIQTLLNRRFASSLAQLVNLKTRVSDKQSKVLVTGDLNAGKSTYVNALLRREVMPTDQQPCTTVFCEVLDAEEGNSGKETVHMLKKSVKYDINDSTTYSEHTLDDIENLNVQAEELDAEDAPIVKCYCKDVRATQESLLRSGVVDISLIDAPGLNRDSVKTTNLFARQDEIDVVVFVVSAENHFTLSAKEFLWNASNDKAYVFIVVNKYDQIKNKERCRQRVLEQIRQLSPRTYEDAENLVHFVDSNAALLQMQQESAGSQPFNQMEAALRDFVLHKRSVSKLQPAQTYLLKVLFDIAFLAKNNVSVASREASEAKAALAIARPALKEAQVNAKRMEKRLVAEEEGAVEGVEDGGKTKLENAVARVAEGKSADATISLPSYPGFWSAWEYATDVREAMLQSIEVAVRNVEELARDVSKDAVAKIQKLGDSQLREEKQEKKDLSGEVDKMFQKRRSRTAFAGLGLGPELVQVKITDIFDAKHHFMVVTGMDEDAKKDQDEEVSLVNSVSLGLGAMTLLGGKAFGAKTAVDLFVRVSDLIGNPTARRWALPIFAIGTTGLVAWTIIDLPNAIPRNIGRSLAKELRQKSTRRVSKKKDIASTEEEKSAVVIVSYSFSEIQSRRIGKECRFVLRLAGHDLQDRFRQAIKEKDEEVKKQETKEKKASVAKTWFESKSVEVQQVRKDLEQLKGIVA